MFDGWQWPSQTDVTFAGGYCSGALKRPLQLIHKHGKIAIAIWFQRDSRHAISLTINKRFNAFLTAIADCRNI
jgi:hypothetical protein